MAIGITQDGRETIILVSGVFDGAAAAKLRSIFTGSSPTGPKQLVVDFSHAREITDIALAALVEAKRADAVQLRMRGLSERHSRMLRFLSPGDADVGGRQ